MDTQMRKEIPTEAQALEGTAQYDRPVGGWGSAEGILAVERTAHAGPGAFETLARLNKPGGTMCNSCAWSKPPNPGAAEFCENGAKATIWDLTSARCGPDVFAQHTVAELAVMTEFELEKLGRLTHPMRYEASGDCYVETTWDAAFAAIGARLAAIDPNATCFYVSGKASLETSYLFALYARVHGHNNLPDSSNMCHETTSVALKKVLGSPVGVCRMEDFEHCDAIFYIGQNPGVNSPRILHPLKKAVERGCEIVAFNPLKERGLIEFADPQSVWQMTVGASTALASQYVQVRPGGDIAALTGVAKHVLELDAEALARGEDGVLDRGFIAQQTSGFDEWLAFVEASDWAEIEREAGVAREELERAAHTYVRAKAVIGIYGMGLTQHVHGSQAVGAFVNLLLMRGNIGRSGAGMQPIRGHSNVQGQRTVGVTEKPELAPNDKYRELFGFAPPMRKGHNTVEFLEALISGEMRAYVGLGGNLMRAVPDAERVEQAWRGMELTVHIATRLNRTHLTPGAESWILPCLVRSEIDEQASGPQQVSTEDSFSQIYGSVGKRTPASEFLKSELAIVCGLAKATLPANPRLRWDDWTGDYRLVRDLIAQSFPDQFADMDQRIDIPGGFNRGNAAHERIWKTESGKAEFTTPTTLDATGLARAPGRYRLITLRSNDQFNTTVYGLSDRLRGIEGERTIVMMSPRDMEAAGVEAGQRITLVTDLDDGFVRRVAGLRVIPYDLPEGALCGYFPELNALAPLSRYDLASHTPASKAIPVRIEAIPAARV
jgi:molybdopterin-dependent oxidoreductase alpha subunit